MCKIEIHLKSCIFYDFEPLGGPRSQKTHKFLLFFDDLEFAPGIPGIRGSGVKKCCSDPTSTRAGGQDDVS